LSGVFVLFQGFFSLPLPFYSSSKNFPIQLPLLFGKGSSRMQKASLLLGLEEAGVAFPFVGALNFVLTRPLPFSK